MQTVGGEERFLGDEGGARPDQTWTWTWARMAGESKTSALGLGGHWLAKRPLLLLLLLHSVPPITVTVTSPHAYIQPLPSPSPSAEPVTYLALPLFFRLIDSSCAIADHFILHPTLFTQDLLTPACSFSLYVLLTKEMV